MRICIETYGCSANQAESEMMAGLLEKAGHELVKDERDILIINSCIVKEPTEQRLLSRLRKVKGTVIVAGCAPEGIYGKIKEAAPGASMVSTHHISKITDVVKESHAGNRVELVGGQKEIKLDMPRVRTYPIAGIVPILSGCNSSCSYCCVRHVKGELFSYPKEKIVGEVATAIEQGCKEIWITSQDNSCYGLDTGGGLPELLDHISQIDGKFLVRVGMMNPKNVVKILPELVESYDSDKIYKFLHLPVQSGSDDVLKRMNRNYTAEDFKKIVSAFREKFPQIQLWTDVIVGFPGETEREFQETVNLLKEVRPDYVNISKYGRRDNTPSSKMKEVPTEIKKQRSKIITNLAIEISVEKNQGWVGWEGEVLIVEEKKNCSLGRNFAYKPLLVKSDKIGEFIRVKIIDPELNVEIIQKAAH